jgi:protein arginine kinase
MSHEPGSPETPAGDPPPDRPGLTTGGVPGGLSGTGGRDRLPPEPNPEWLRGEGNAGDVVLSSRVRLARNLASLPFSSKASRRERSGLVERCREVIAGANLAPSMVWVDLHACPTLDRTLMVERHLISKQHAKGKAHGGSPASEDPRAVAFSAPDERLAIMINEEDHLRLQVIRSGLSLAQAWEEIDVVDDRLEAGLDFAFHPTLGFLTACPTNVGTGLRMSVMLHLPGLRLTGEFDKVKRAAADMSLAVRGFYGEGSDALGDLYQISNQTTLGRSEAQILAELEREILPKVVDYERTSRQQLSTKHRLGLEDQVHRALGALRYARLLATEEAMQLLSLARLGVLLGLVQGVSQQTINRLMLVIQPAHLQRAFGTEMDQEQRREARATLVRRELTDAAR